MIYDTLLGSIGGYSVSLVNPFIRMQAIDRMESVSVRSRLGDSNTAVTSNLDAILIISEGNTPLAIP